MTEELDRYIPTFITTIPTQASLQISPGPQSHFFQPFPPTQETRYPMLGSIAMRDAMVPLTILSRTDHPTNTQHFATPNYHILYRQSQASYMACAHTQHLKHTVPPICLKPISYPTFSNFFTMHIKNTYPHLEPLGPKR
ncbi:Hypothetical predicted protein [Pelobates cultripes]|uniref:Uncharacterized protein n=1 Tax=Pelobates cultripes TaxID=61616 RepID=A0AAD1RXZ7_PELCU|nr:Hypothetical predicted protein [Pelobates cultripes]